MKYRLPEPAKIKDTQAKGYLQKLIHTIKRNFDGIDNTFALASEAASSLKTVGAQVNNVVGTVAVATQVDGFSNDAIDSVSHTSTGIVVVNFKAGYFTSTPVVTASAYGSVNNNWIVSVNSVSTTSVTVYTFTSGTTLTDFHFSLTAVGI